MTLSVIIKNFKKEQIMEELKISKRVAKLLLEYIAMEDCRAKRNIDALCGKKINSYLKKIDKYCEKEGLTREQVLVNIFEA